MANFDTNITLRVLTAEAEKKLKKFENELKSLERKTLSRAKKNEGLASNLKTGRAAAEAAVRTRLQRQQVKALNDATKAEDKRLNKEIRIEAAQKRQETLTKALNRAGLEAGSEAEKRVKDLLAAGKATKGNLTIQNAVNAGLEKELQLRREINRTQLAADEARSKGALRGSKLNDLETRGASASKINELRKLNDDYVKAAEKGESDIAKALDRRYKRKSYLVERDVKAQEKAAKQQKKVEDNVAKEAKKIYDQLLNDRKTGQIRDLNSRTGFDNLKKQADEVRKTVSLSKTNANTMFDKLFRDADAIRKAFPKDPQQNLGLPALPAAGQSSYKQMKAVAEQQLVRDKASTAEKAKQKRLQDDIVNRGLKRLNTVSNFQKFLREGNDILEQIRKKEKDITAEKGKQGKAIKDNNKGLVDTAKKVGRVGKTARKTTKQKTKSKLNERIQGALLGGSFPLLFGGPSFSAAGGALGGLAGGQAGFAFGIALSALGSAFDAAAQRAIALGNALRDPTNNIEELTKVLDIAGTASSGLIKDLQKLGANEIAASVATNELNKRLREFGVDPEQFKKQSKELQNSISRLNFALAALGTTLIPFINNLTNAASRLAGVKGPGPTSATQGAGGAVSGASRAAFNPADSFLNVKEEAALQQLLKSRLQAERNILSVKRQDLDLDKLERATLEGNLAIQQKTQEFVNLQSRARFEQNSILKRQLQDEANILNIQRQQLVVAKQNAEFRAAQEIAFSSQRRNRAADVQAAQNALSTMQQVLIDRDLLGRNSAMGEQMAAGDTYELTVEAIEKVGDERLRQLDTEINQLRLKRDLSVEEKASQENLLRAQKEAVKVSTQASLRQIRLDAARLQVMQRQVEQQRELARLQQSQALAAAQQASPLNPMGGSYLDTLGQGLGFFSDAMNLASERTLKFNQQVEIYNQQIKQLKDLRDIPGQTAEATVALNNQIKDVESSLANLIEFQPQLDKLAVVQQTYSDALAITTPLASSFVSALKDVATGAATAQEALATFVQSIADIFLNQAAEQLAKGLAIIATEQLQKLTTESLTKNTSKALTENVAGVAGTAVESAAGVATDVAGVATETGSAATIAASNTSLVAALVANTAAVTANTAALTVEAVTPLSEGGFVTGPTNALVAEAGESEYVIPASKMDGAMARYSAGARGSAVLAGADSDSGYGSTAVMDAPMSININGGVTTMGGNDYIRKDELPSIINQSAKAGEAKALRRLRQSPSTRRSVGL